MSTTNIKHFTLCFITDENRVLLGMKKRGFGEGKWNGFGGKVAEGETYEAAARRELEEESGIVAVTLDHRAVFDFVAKKDSALLRVNVYHVPEYEGEPKETEEMRPQWFAHAAVPYGDMWADDIHWLPKFLEGERMQGTFHFDDLSDANAKLLGFKLETINAIR